MCSPQETNRRKEEHGAAPPSLTLFSQSCVPNHSNLSNTEVMFQKHCLSRCSPDIKRSPHGGLSAPVTSLFAVEPTSAVVEFSLMKLSRMSIAC